MKRALGMALAILATAAVGSAAAELRSPVERRIAAAVDRGTPAALQLLHRTVDINSGTMNLDGVREVGKVFRAEFDALGFATR